MTFYPVYLTRLDQQKVVVIGGNGEAERKTLELLSFGARVHLIGNPVTELLRTLYEQNRLQWTPREYEYGDLKECGFVVAAEYSDNTAEQVHHEARERNLIVNIMDNIPLSNSAFGSVVKRGKLTVSFSTSGLAPALAVRLKERFEQEIDASYAAFLHLAEQLRPSIIATINNFDERKQKWYQWVDSDVICALRAGEQKRALETTREVWGAEVMEHAGITDASSIEYPTIHPQP